MQTEEEKNKNTHLPLGSVCLDQVGVHRSTVEAQRGGKCSSNMRRYQYLGRELALCHDILLPFPQYVRLLGVRNVGSPLGLGVLEHLVGDV